jgi:hypothetical protein
LLRSNIPSRIALTVQKATESRIILDDVGAEHLLGKGDMLIKLIGQPLIRVHGVLIGHDDIAQGIARAKGRTHEPADPRIHPFMAAIDRIGPFQERMEEIDFTDANNESCNLYLFLSKNGRGKTTALELMAALMGMLGCDDIRHQMVERRGTTGERPFDLEHLDRGKGRAQWDLRVRYSEDSIERTVVLSLLAGG